MTSVRERLVIRAPGSRLPALFNDPAWRTAIFLFVVLRVFLTLWMWGVRQVIDLPLPPHPVLRPHVGVEVETNPWLEPWQRWDTLHYQAIAERGYSAFDTALFVPPLYPFLISLLAPLLGGSTLLAGIIIANAAMIYSLVILYRTVIFETRNRVLAQRSLVYLVFFPAAIFLVAAYTESLFLLAAAACLFAIRRNRWWTAGFWGAVAALTRLPGALILIPLGYAAWCDWRETGHMRSLAGFGTAVAGAGIFPLYVWLVLRLPPWTPILVQSARFQGGLAWPGANLLEAARRLIVGEFLVGDVLDLLFILAFLFAGVFVWRWLPRIYSVYYLTFIGLYLVRMSTVQPLLGTSRYVLSLFPAFIVFARLGQRPSVHRLILYSSWLLLLFMAGQFAIWGWVG